MLNRRIEHVLKKNMSTKEGTVSPFIHFAEAILHVKIYTVVTL